MGLWWLYRTLPGNIGLTHQYAPADRRAAKLPSPNNPHQLLIRRKIGSKHFQFEITAKWMLSPKI
jgi:hypothetical protein